MDEVLQIALEEKLPELAEETPVALAAVMPPVLPDVAAGGTPVGLNALKYAEGRA